MVLPTGVDPRAGLILTVTRTRSMLLRRTLGSDTPTLTVSTIVADGAGHGHRLGDRCHHGATALCGPITSTVAGSAVRVADLKSWRRIALHLRNDTGTAFVADGSNVM